MLLDSIWCCLIFMSIFMNGISLSFSFFILSLSDLDIKILPACLKRESDVKHTYPFCKQPCFPLWSSFSLFFLSIFYWLCYYSCPIFSLPFLPLHPAPSLPPASPTLTSCPWVVHISSVAPPFPILFLTSPCLVCTYNLGFLFPVPFLPFSTLHFPADVIHPCDLYFCDSVSILVCFVWFLFLFFLGSVVDSCEFVVILLFIFLIIFFFLDKSLSHFL